MTQGHRELVNILVTFLIIIFTIYVAQRFFLPLAWAAIIAIVSWPIYLRFEKFFRGNEILAATALTILITCVVALPLTWVLLIIIKETRILFNFLMGANTSGVTSPEWINNLPYIGTYLKELWMDVLGQPQGISNLLASGSLGSLKPMNEFLKKVGVQLAHRGFIFGFMVMCLFFFYKDGKRIVHQIHKIGSHCLGDRWYLYSKTVPGTLKATVNGLVLVGIVVGLLMGISYGIAGMPAPALLGAATAILAMIPFGAPVAFGIVTITLIAQGHMITGLAIFAWGALVMFVADHFVRPNLIGGAVELPFLAVLIGILGGVETMGLIGLFIGPAIMVLFVTLWREPQFRISQKKTADE